jgi:hypothetical protein
VHAGLACAVVLASLGNAITLYLFFGLRGCDGCRGDAGERNGKQGLTAGTESHRNPPV